jgi:hypothetical protein
MKSMAVAFMFVISVIGLLRSDLTPWRLMTVKELDEMKASQVPVVAVGTPKPTGTWMWDSTYRTSLEKTTVIGRPEGAKSREIGH